MGPEYTPCSLTWINGRRVCGQAVTGFLGAMWDRENQPSKRGCCLAGLLLVLLLVLTGWFALHLLDRQLERDMRDLETMFSPSCGAI